jgi:hypothetical protein
MGYMIEQRESKFRIPAEKHEACLAAIKAIPLGDPHVGNGGGHSWVGEYDKATTLVDAFYEWRWNARFGPLAGGDLTDLWFEGEKYGDDEVLWEAIAPYVDAGSYIEMSGEEGEVWRWVFDGSTFHTHYGKMTWDYPGADE